MTKKKPLSGWQFYLLGPVVVALSIFALVVSFAATYDAYRATQVNALLISLIAEVRQLKVLPTDTHERVSREFFNRLVSYGSYPVAQVSTGEWGRAEEKAVTLPTGGAVQFTFFPSVSSFRIQVEVTPSVCRRILSNFVSFDRNLLKLRRVDVKENDPARVWRKIYEENDKGDVLSADNIYVGCGTTQDNLLSMTFFM